MRSTHAVPTQCTRSAHVVRTLCKYLAMVHRRGKLQCYALRVAVAGAHTLWQLSLVKNATWHVCEPVIVEGMGSPSSVDKQPRENSGSRARCLKKATLTHTLPKVQIFGQLSVSRMGRLKYITVHHPKTSPKNQLQHLHPNLQQGLCKG